MISLVALSFMAGNIAVLSPCVLPAIPFIISSALEKNKLGPVILSLGLITSFTVIGASIAMFGSFLGLDQDLIRKVSAMMMLVLGLAFVSVKIQNWSNLEFNRLANIANNILDKAPLTGLKGQFLVGLLVGAVWSPCIGPTLGSAIALAGQTKTRFQGSSLILIYSLGIIVPFLLMAYCTHYFGQIKSKAITFAVRGKFFLGLIMITFGISVLTGLDKAFEGLVFDLMPTSLLNFITGV